MLQNLQPLTHNLVLIGGGHTHAIVLRMFGMKPLSGVRLTLITPSVETPYSGMLPGHISGVYNHDECHINLQRLANFAQAQLYIDTAVDLDLKNYKVICASHQAVDFDLLSIDIGSTPATMSVSGAAEYAVPAKPVSQLLEHWYQMLDSVVQKPQINRSIAIAGGGAGGVELALSMQAHLHRIFKQAQQPLSNLEIHLFHRQAELMSHHHPSVQRQVKQVLMARGVKLHLKETVSHIAPSTDTQDEELLEVQCESGIKVNCHKIFWVTQASAPQWLKATGLATDERGFILVEDTLQSPTHPEVFAAGDIATMIHHPRPKAGVFAVRQGKPLFDNLRRKLRGQPLKPYKPQQQYLSLIGTGDKRAIATKGCITLPPHQLCWQWKDWLDRRFMQQFP
ncbi:Ankyrin [Trichormus variabilis ATCC 29413]|uniref:Ankyrin n=2 Tax=Anabaena variabilis TaxID=264691 RepID=Q3M374_TRIV2|nr:MULTISPECIES: FAD-dependent oxidoreductase [Nostocaceae]ABA24562.1 Ankyrin [Trichormus variabilis ATCC 29413]MBC1212843.1 FAD-dependent oxidoreductase [Trichormus variabilis ARAD]MBC1258721.1 FAD-dependent oxidoreductase [Trichormus variabilis V5]MBC1266062.1 FAD-dependent oxidoreductase [Trichormus variabilis FSR]MBC1301289.1 FAD-dependent oxidoreductase [Trichormus variabilis N2B]